MRKFIFLLLLAPLAAHAQQPNQIDLKIDPSNRTLTLTAQDEVTVDADLAILHVGFTTPQSDAKSAYAAATQTSNTIIAALKQAGIADADIHSESQNMQPVYQKPHKFTLYQQWTVKCAPVRAAEILDIAITAGATESGDIEWTMRDPKALESQAIRAASTRLRDDATALAESMGVRLGKVLYTTNSTSGPSYAPRVYAMNAMANRVAAPAAQPLAIEPQKVSRSATIYAVYAIE
jgi:uncharacterized protein YggE